MTYSNDYAPTKRIQKILNKALERVNSVNYVPSSRWCFYQVYQMGLVTKKDKNNFDHWTSRARKNFWNGWNPATLKDSVRFSILRGFPEPPKPAKPDYIELQDNYVEVWFEARAMIDQFNYYVKDKNVTMVAFGGDASIPFKWEIAKRLESVFEAYGKPIKILYFGDCDTKGLLIPECALKDIRSWCNVDFEFSHCGLNKDQAKAYNVPENPNKPGEYQWEALTDKQARELILGGLKKVWDW